MKIKGFTLVEIMIVVAIIALLAAIAIPNLLRAKLTANESAAQAALKTIATAEITYRSAGNSAYGDLPALIAVTPPYIDTVLGTSPHVKNGYTFAATVEGTEGFYATAVPVSAGKTGVRSFCITEEGVVKANATGATATNITCASSVLGFAATSP